MIINHTVKLIRAARWQSDIDDTSMNAFNSQGSNMKVSSPLNSLTIPASIFFQLGASILFVTFVFYGNLGPHFLVLDHV